MKLVKTIYNTNLRKPDYYTVEVGNIRKMFPASQKKEIGKFISRVWKDQEQFYKKIPDEAYIFYNIDWDSDHVLYCSYKKIPEGDYFNEDKICDDTWYNRVPEDNFFCSSGDRKETEDE